MTDTICDLVLEACQLLESADRLPPDEALAEAAHLRALLCDALSTCAGDTAEDVIADGRAAIADLDALTARHGVPARAEVPQAA